MPNIYESKKKGGATINVQTSKTVTAGTSAETVQPDTGYDAMGEVVVNPTPSQSKSVTAGTTTTTVTPDSGKLLSSVSVAPTPSTPITPSSSGTQFSAGLNNMSSSGWAYSSQPSGGTIKRTTLLSPTIGAGSFNLSDSNYNLIKSGKAMIVAGMSTFQNPQGNSYGGELFIRLTQSGPNYSVIASSNIGTSKTIYYVFNVNGAQASGSGFIYLVYIE